MTLWAELLILQILRHNFLQKPCSFISKSQEKKSMFSKQSVTTVHALMIVSYDDCKPSAWQVRSESNTLSPFRALSHTSLYLGSLSSSSGPCVKFLEYAMLPFTIGHAQLFLQFLHSQENDPWSPTPFPLSSSQDIYYLLLYSHKV